MTLIEEEKKSKPQPKQQSKTRTTDALDSKPDYSELN